MSNNTNIIPEDNDTRKIHYLNLRHQGYSDYVALKVSGYVKEEPKPMTISAVRKEHRKKRMEMIAEAQREESNAMTEEAKIAQQREVDAKNSNAANKVSSKPKTDKELQNAAKGAWGQK